MTRLEQDALEKAFAIEDALDTVFSVETLAKVAAIILGDRSARHRFIERLEHKDNTK